MKGIHKHLTDDGVDYVGPLADDDTQGLRCLVARYHATGANAIALPPSGDVALEMDHATTCHPTVISQSPWKIVPAGHGFVTVIAMWSGVPPAGWTPTTLRLSVYKDNVLHELPLDREDAVTGGRVTLQGSLLVDINDAAGDFLDLRLGQAAAVPQIIPAGSWDAYVQVLWAAHHWCGGCG